MNSRTRNSIGRYLQDPIAQVTDLSDIINECLVPEFKKPTIRICSWDGGLIRNEDKKPIYLTEFQKGYLHALLSLPENNLDAKEICRPQEYDTHALYATHSMCATCKPRLMEEAEKYGKK